MHGESTIKGLLAFVSIAEHGSINRAARALNISQPSLTRTLQQFESMIGAPVFVREAKGATLNELGKQLLAHAQIIRAEANNAVRTVDLFRREKRRQLHIGAVTAHPLVQFAEAIMEFMHEETNLFLRISHGSLDELMDMLREGAIEMVFGPLVKETAGQVLVQDTIYEDAVSLYCSPQAAVAKTAAVSLDDLYASPWILPPVGTPARDKVTQLFAAAGRPEPNVIIEVENVPMRRALVQRSAGISVFHDHHVHPEVENGALRRIDFDWTCGVGPIGSIRLTPHTPTSLRLLRVFEARYAAAGLRCRTVPEKTVSNGIAVAASRKGNGLYAGH